MRIIETAGQMVFGKRTSYKKCFVIEHKQNKPQLLSFPPVKRDPRQQYSTAGQQFSKY